MQTLTGSRVDRVGVRKASGNEKFVPQTPTFLEETSNPCIA